MSEKYGQIQEQKQQQQLKLGQAISHQQLLQASLVELPITQLVDRINTEINDNPALEAESHNDAMDYVGGTSEENSETLGDTGAMGSDDEFSAQAEREERMSALDEALAGIGRDDEDLPVYHGGSNLSEEREEMVYGQTESFYEHLMSQVSETDLTERQRDILEYLIGSLDDDGLLRKSIDVISDELAIYHNVDATNQEVEHMLSVLHDFDPAGIGARSLQECLLIQIARRDNSILKTLMNKVINEYFDEFTKKHWDKIMSSLSLTDDQASALFGELRKLNPRPGASLGETVTVIVPLPLPLWGSTVNQEAEEVTFHSTLEVTWMVEVPPVCSTVISVELTERSGVTWTGSSFLHASIASAATAAKNRDFFIILDI